MGLKGNWEMVVHVGDFAPEDIIVKTVNKSVEVNAEKMSGDGKMEAEFSHRCQLPSNVDATSVTSQLKRDGTLVLRANWLQTHSK